MDTRTITCYHIVESWDIEKMMEEPPTDEYYDLLRKDMGHRHPKACPHLLDHLVSLEAFLDKSILFGFSFGGGNAEVCVAESKLLGHSIGRHGSGPRAVSSHYRLPTLQGEVAHSAVFGLIG